MDCSSEVPATPPSVRPDHLVQNVVQANPDALAGAPRPECGELPALHTGETQVGPAHHCRGAYPEGMFVRDRHARHAGANADFFGHPGRQSRDTGETDQLF